MNTAANGVVGLRFAVLSDIHGNVWALEAVLEDAKRREIDQFINLGDILYGPLKPLETYRLLETVDVITIQGNEDRDIYEFDCTQAEAKPTLAYMIEQLNSSEIEWLKSLPKTAIVAEEVFACHGTPTSDLIYLLEDISTGSPIVRTEAAILSHLDGVNFPIILCGHSHIPRVVQLSSGSLIVNPGSVGVPAYDDDLPNYHAMQNYSPLASYAVIEKHNHGWQVDLLKIPYNVHLAVEQARHQGRDDWADWIETGRVAMP